jgi:hypothetical protein
MAKPKGTPKRGKHNHASPRHPKPSSPAKQKVKAVDLVRLVVGTASTLLSFLVDNISN